MDLIIAVSEAGGRVAISIERVAIDDTRIADNDNYQPKNIKIPATSEMLISLSYQFIKFKGQCKYKVFQHIYLIQLVHTFATM